MISLNLQISHKKVKTGDYNVKNSVYAWGGQEDWYSNYLLTVEGYPSLWYSPTVGSIRDKKRACIR